MITNDRINALKWVGGGGGRGGPTARVLLNHAAKVLLLTVQWAGKAKLDAGTPCPEWTPADRRLLRSLVCCVQAQRGWLSAAADPGGTCPPERCSGSKGKRKVIHRIAGRADGLIQQVSLPVCFCGIVLELH